MDTCWLHPTVADPWKENFKGHWGIFGSRQSDHLVTMAVVRCRAQLLTILDGSLYAQV
jgi:hypothetical protein